MSVDDAFLKYFAAPRRPFDPNIRKMSSRTFFSILIPEGYNVKLSIYVKISTLGACTEIG